jgi:hypothetical protein
LLRILGKSDFDIDPDRYKGNATWYRDLEYGLEFIGRNRGRLLFSPFAAKRRSRAGLTVLFAWRTSEGMQKRSRMPRDTNQLAHKVLQIAIGEDIEAEKPDDGKDPAAVALGRKGGLKGGKARWKGVSKKERSKIARKAAQSRWHKRES